MIFSTSVKNGILKLTNEERIDMDQYVKSLEGKSVWVIITDVKPPRSLQQNAYYFGVVIQYISDETGESPEKTHEDLKEKFLPRMWTVEDGREVEFPKSTTRLSTKEFKDYLESVIAWAASFLNLVIPDPNE